MKYSPFNNGGRTLVCAFYGTNYKLISLLFSSKFSNISVWMAMLLALVMVDFEFTWVPLLPLRPLKVKRRTSTY